MTKSKSKYFAHGTAVIDEPVEIGNGTKIWHFSHVMAGAVIGKECNIGQNVFVGSKARVGNNVKIQNNVSVYDGVILEDYVFCGPSCVFTNVNRPRTAFPRKDRTFDETLVRKGVTIGANATIVCGTTIGQHAFIGAGAVVTKDVPAYSLQMGNPAEHRGWMCECGERLDDPATGRDVLACPACSRKYAMDGDGITKVEG